MQKHHIIVSFLLLATASFRPVFAESSHFDCRATSAAREISGKLTPFKGATENLNRMHFQVEKRTGQITEIMELGPNTTVPRVWAMDPRRTTTNWHLRPKTGNNTWSYRVMTTFGEGANFWVLYLEIKDIEIIKKPPYPFFLTWRETLWAGKCD